MSEQSKKEFDRDKSVNRGSYLTGNTPKPKGESGRKEEKSDISESGMPKILRELKKRTGFDPENLEDDDN